MYCTESNLASTPLAVCAIEVADILQIVSDESAEKRGRTIPIGDDRFQWWTDAVKRQLALHKLNQKQLADELELPESAVSRCISRAKPVYETLLAISERLEVAFPVILPESEDEALYLATQRRLIRRDIQVKQIVTGVGKPSRKGQTPAVVSEHAFRSEGSGKSKRASSK